MGKRTQNKEQLLTKLLEQEIQNSLIKTSSNEYTLKIDQTAVMLVFTDPKNGVKLEKALAKIAVASKGLING